MTVRVLGAVGIDPERGPEQVRTIQALRAEYDSEHVRVDAAKLYLDGVIESGTARLVEPYADGENGPVLFADSTLDAMIPALDAAGLQIHAHAIGDGAVRQYLDAIERVRRRDGALERGPMVAHLQLVHPDDVGRFAELGVYASFSAVWAWPDDAVVELADPVLGPERAERQYPIASLRDAGAAIVAGSDWSVSTMNPWPAIEAGITRTDPEGARPLALTTSEAVDLDTMLAAYTRVAAEAAGLSDELGTLSVGKQADLVHVDADPYALDPEELSEVEVLSTWFEGHLVWQDARRPVVRP